MLYISLLDHVVVVYVYFSPSRGVARHGMAIERERRWGGHCSVEVSLGWLGVGLLGCAAAAV